MTLAIIAAIDEKRGLGKNNQLLFKIKEDFIRMKKLTSGHPIIMGRKTFESIGRPLPNRTNIVITRDEEYQAEGIKIVHSLEEAIRVAKNVDLVRHSGNPPAGGASRISNENKRSWTSQDDDEGEIFIFGGGEIFKEALPLTDRLYLTVVQGDYDADTFFPAYEKEFTKVLENQTKTADGYTYVFLTLERPEKLPVFDIEIPY